MCFDVNMEIMTQNYLKDRHYQEFFLKHRAWTNFYGTIFLFGPRSHLIPATPEGRQWIDELLIRNSLDSLYCVLEKDSLSAV